MLIKENKLERDSYEGTHGPGCNSQSISVGTHIHCTHTVCIGTYWIILPHAPTAQMPLIQTCRYTNTHIDLHINRNTPSLAHKQRSQTPLLAGCDYIQERGNVLRLRWEVVDGGDMSALALNFTQDCLPISPCPFLTLRVECAVGCWKCGAMAQWAECSGTARFHQNTLLTLPFCND